MFPFVKPLVFFFFRYNFKYVLLKFEGWIYVFTSRDASSTLKSCKALVSLYLCSYTWTVIFQCYEPQLLSMYFFYSSVKGKENEQEEKEEVFSFHFTSRIIQVSRPSSYDKCLFFVTPSVIDRRLKFKKLENCVHHERNRNGHERIEK